MPPTLSRRSFLAGSVGAAVLAACGGDDSSSSSGGSATTSTSEPGIVLGTTFDQQGLLVAGREQRLPFVLFESTGGLLDFDRAPASIDFDVDGEVVTVAKSGADVERAYYPLRHTFPEPGTRSISAKVEGATIEREVNVNDPSAVLVPQVGDPMPAPATPTVAAPLGVATICTDDPPCPLHEVSLGAAVLAGRPVAFLVSTPAYCQVAICGPVLDLLVAAAGSGAWPGIDFVHLEVYPDGEPTADGSTLSPLVTDPFHLNYEPVLFVADATGTITARLDNIYDSPELEAALRTVTA